MKREILKDLDLGTGLVRKINESIYPFKIRSLQILESVSCENQAETSGGITLLSCAVAGIPVSTTHVITSSIMGVGTTKPGRAVRWVVFRNIAWAWIFTIPAALVISFISFKITLLFL